MRALSGFCQGLLFASLLFSPAANAVIRDGGVDPANLGKGDWIYYVSAATNRLGGNVPGVTNESSLMVFYKSNGVRYIIVKAATSDYLFNGSYSFPQFTRQLVDTAHAHGILIFGYNRSYGENIPGEVAIADFVFQQGADGFVFDAEGEWEDSQPWIGKEGPAKAWSLCSQVRSNWPTKFLAHAPFPIISYHSSFPYKEFGYWCDAVMPQIYPQNWSGVKSRPSGGINWTDANFGSWQKGLYNLPATNINGIQVWWTNSIKPLAPVNHVYGPNPPNSGVSHIDDDFVMEFLDYLCADPHAVTVGGYQGANFWRADLHGSAQWINIGRSTIGSFTGKVGNLVMDDPSASVTGTWTAVRTFSNGKFYGYANGSGTDTNSFGTNYLTVSKGTGGAWVEFRPKVLVSGDYDMYQWHPWLAASSAAVPHVVLHSGGETVVYANQRTNAGRWSLLGRFSFLAGTNGFVRVLDSVPEPNAVAVADGLKMVFVPPLSLPNAPTGLTATAEGSSRINLTWVDNSTNEASFTIYRAMASGGPYVEAGLVGTDRTQWSDQGLMDGTTYYYVVKAGNFLGTSANSLEAYATTVPLVPKPPQILDQPKEAGVPEGASATFEVVATGTPPLSFQWWFGGQAIQSATGSSWTIPAVEPSFEGTYIVVVSNRYGRIESTPARLAIVTVGVSGDGSLGQRDVPASAKGLIALSAGGWHFLGLRPDGTLCAWGANWDGQCNVPRTPLRIIAAAAGGYHSLAILEDLTVCAWGANQSGQCAVPPEARDVISVAGGQWHSAAVRTDGRVVLWGDNSWGQLQPPAGLGGVVAVAAGAGHTLALKSDGTVVGWGANYDGQGLYTKQALPPPGYRAKAIAAGDYHSLALLTNGSVAAWGANSHWQCSVPVQVTNAIAIAAGAAHSLALLRSGTVVAWGANSSGQCTIWQGGKSPIAMAAGGATSALLWEDGFVPALLWAPRLEPGVFRAVAQTLCGRFYSMERTDSLPSVWTAVEMVEGNGGLVLVRDTTPAASLRFYRLSPR